MSNCEYYQELISCLIDGELGAEEERALAQHLRECESCRALHEAFAAVSAAVEEDMVDAPESISINVMARLRRDEIVRKNRKKASKRLKGFIAAAACLVLILGVGVLKGAGRGTESAAIMASVPKSAAEEAPAEAATEELPVNEAAFPAETVTDSSAAEVYDSADMPEFESEDTAAGTESYALRSASEEKCAPAQDSTLPTWESVSAVLAGSAAECSLEELSIESSFYIDLLMNNEPMQLEIYVCENGLFYTDPISGCLMKCGCEVDAFGVFLT